MFFFVHFPDWKIGIHCFLAVPTSQVFRYIYLFGTFRLAYRRVIFDRAMLLCHHYPFEFLADMLNYPFELF